MLRLHPVGSLVTRSARQQRFRRLTKRVRALYYVNEVDPCTSAATLGDGMSSLTGKAQKMSVKASTGEAAPPDGHPAEVAKVVVLAPGIVSDPGICGGDPTIAGTRIGVDDVAAL